MFLGPSSRLNDVSGWLNRDPIGIAGGLNLYAYVGNNPISNVDPLGLATSVLNRLLNPSGGPNGYPAPNNNYATHTFVYTTNPDGSLSHTYSWGNTYDANGNGVWHTDAPEDTSAAQYAIGYNQWYNSAAWWQQIFSQTPYGITVGGDELDPFVAQAFQMMQDSAGHKWCLTDNCKDDASALIDLAKQLQQQKNSSCGSQ